MYQATSKQHLRLSSFKSSATSRLTWKKRLLLKTAFIHLFKIGYNKFKL